MVLSLVKGQKIDVTKNNSDMNLLHIGLDWSAPSTFDIDVSAFLLGSDEKIVREEDFVFYGQPASSNGSVKLEESISTIEKQHFIIDLQTVPNDVEKISFTMTIYESEINGHTFEEVSDIQLRMVNSRRQVEMANFPIEYPFTKETAVVFGTLYRYSGEWKFHAVGAGFYGGLADLCDEFGVEVNDRPVEQAQNEVPAIPTHTPISQNQRFQVVQGPEGIVTGEVIPKPPEEYVQLKRSSVVQFNDSRIETLSNQSTELINLFSEHEEEVMPTVTPNPIEPPLTSNFLLTNAEEQDQEAFFKSLTRVEKTFLLKIENRQISINETKEYLKPQGLMVALFINTINEKANEHLDDNLLQFENEFIKVYEEFASLVEMMKENVRNEH